MEWVRVAIPVAIGGGAGAVLRYIAAGTVQRWVGSDFPWGTLAVNLLGALAMGLLVALFARVIDATEYLRLLLITGFLGGFTTFSAFSMEVLLMLHRQQWLWAAGYVALSVGGCVAAVFLAMWLGSSIGR